MKRTLLVTLLFAAGCTTPTFTELPKMPEPTTRQPPEYRMLPGHSVTLLDPANKVAVATVDEKGCIDLPKIGTVHVGGMTLEQLQQQIGTAYRVPLFTIPTCDDVPPLFYCVKGQVRFPGREVYLAPTTLAQAIDNAGGFTPAAKVSKVVVRRGNGAVERYNWRRLTNGSQAMPQVGPNDTIEVMRRGYDR